MARVLLLLPSSTYRAPGFLAAAVRLEVEVVTGSEENQALSTMMGDRFLHLPVDDPPRAAKVISDFARRVPLDAVIAVDDRGARTAALAAQMLGLRANAPDAVAAATDKSLLRARLAGGGVAQPRYLLCRSGGDRPRDIATALAALGFPVVMKPVSLAGSRGVIRADDPAGAAGAARRIEAILRDCGHDEEPILIEEFIPGNEVALEGMLDRATLHTLCLFDKPDPLDGPYFEETIYVTPSRLSETDQRGVVDLVASACRALGLTEGPVHAEVRLRPMAGRREPVLIEVAARTIGGRCATVLQFATGEHLEDLVISQALGRAITDSPTILGAAGVMMLPIPSSGRLVEVHGRAEALAVEHISGLEISTPRGRQILTLPEGDRYLGFLFAKGPSAVVVEAALRRAHSMLQVEIDQGIEIERGAPKAATG